MLVKMAEGDLKTQFGTYREILYVLFLQHEKICIYLFFFFKF